MCPNPPYSLYSYIRIKMSIYKSMFLNGIVAALLAASAPVSATDDAYLKMLEGEAESLELDQKGQLQSHKAKVPASKKGKDSFGWNATIDGENLPKGLPRKEFETVLQDNFYGTFLFFSKLNSADKQTVYYRYNKAESTNLENVRKNILDLLKR